MEFMFLSLDLSAFSLNSPNTRKIMSMKIRKALLVSGWTDVEPDGRPVNAMANLNVGATGVHHAKIGPLLEAAPAMFEALKAMLELAEKFGFNHQPGYEHGRFVTEQARAALKLAGGGE